MSLFEQKDTQQFSNLIASNVNTDELTVNNDINTDNITVQGTINGTDFTTLTSGSYTPEIIISSGASSILSVNTARYIRINNRVTVCGSFTCLSQPVLLEVVVTISLPIETSGMTANELLGHGTISKQTNITRIGHGRMTASGGDKAAAGYFFGVGSAEVCYCDFVMMYIIK